MSHAIPQVDLHDFIKGTPQQKKDFVVRLGNAFEEFGFVAVKNHGLTDTDTDALYRAYRKFFALPDAVKLKYEIPGGAGQRGYTGKKKETAKGFTSPDLKEFYHTGQTNIPDEPSLAIHYPPNVWPAEVPELEYISVKVFKTLELAGIHLLRALANYLHLPEDYFDKKVETGNSILRAIHYFPITNPESSVRAAAHEDINLITLLMGASAEGLEILNRNGTWIPVTSLPEQIVVNVGDMLSRLTNNVLRSTTHRVVNPEKHLWHIPRFSMPFFMHPRADMDLSCLPSCISAQNPKQFEDLTAGAYLDQRLRELGLKT